MMSNFTCQRSTSTTTTLTAVLLRMSLVALLLSLVMVVVVVAEEDHDASFVIIGGTSVSTGEFPGHAVTDRSNNFLCGGSLIWEDMVLTAAHCRGTFQGGDVYIGGVLLNGNDAVDRIEAQDEIPNPNYDSVSIANDIMLVKLERSSSVTPLPWNTNANVPALESEIVALGFGATEPDDTGSFSNRLLQVDLRVLSSTECAGRTTEQIVCGGAPIGETQASTCAGDSGSPILSSDGVVVGLNSFGLRNGNSECQNTSPTGFTRVSTHEAWIRDTICEESNNPPCDCPNAPDSCNAPPVASPVSSPSANPPVDSLFAEFFLAIVNFFLSLFGIDTI